MTVGLLLVGCDDGASDPGTPNDGGAPLDAAFDGRRPDPEPDATGDTGAEPDATPDASGAGGAGGEGAQGGEGGQAGMGGVGGMVPPAVQLPPEDDCVARVVRIGPLDVFAFEASRPDATADSAGADETRACSQAGVLPWTDVTIAQAQAHCEAAGFHLCDDDEWQAACGGPNRRWPYPYAPRHQPGACNDHVSGRGVLEPGGAHEGCVSPDGVFDMSGNVWEMTASGSRRGASYRLNAVMFRTENASCDVPYFISEVFFSDDMGFRCCRAAP